MESSKQKTAVDWLVQQLIKRDKDLNPSSFAIQIYFESSRNIVEQAKQMEKERMTNFANEYADAVMLGCIKRAEQYLNETYGTE
jgi:hypothetical protein